jgi:hypothetical protein
VGAVAGAIVGGIAGGLAGKAAGEALDPTREDAYWKDNYKNESYYDSNLSYDDYSPAYRVGYMGRSRFADQNFDDVESDLRADYERDKGSSKLDWDRARAASHAAWNRGASSGPT